jgi:hypothetical protein
MTDKLPFNASVWFRSDDDDDGNSKGLQLYEGNRHEGLTDLPQRSGCLSGDTFAGSDAFAALFDDWQIADTEEKKARQIAVADYSAFVSACKTLEEIEVAVKLPEELRKRLVPASNTLVAVSPESLSKIKADFAKAA